MHKYDIVHVHLFPSQYWVAAAKILSFSKAKLITTEHNTSNRRREIFAFKWIDRLVYRRYKRIIGCSNKVSELLISYLENEKNIVSITNGIKLSVYRDAKAISKTELLKIKSGCILLTMVAGFRESKDQDTLIRAMVNLPESFHLGLVGEGVRKADCERLVEELSLSERVHFLGLRNDVPGILKASDIIIMSSHYEGLSLSSIEGMASGRPFIASNVNGLKEITEGAGVLFEEGDASELAEKILFLINNPDKYQEVVQKCQQRASEYDIEKMVDRYIEIYKEVSQ